MVMLREVVSLMEGEWSCYRGGHSLEGEWSCYRGGQFKRGRMVRGRMVLRTWLV